MAEHFDFHYVKTPTGTISGQSVLKQTEDAINEVGEFSYQASLDAASALQKAEQAVDTANTANNTASNALTQVNAAVEKVNTLEVQVGEIAEQVEEANSKSDQAVSTANSALSTAQEALSTANTALSNSEQAVTTANGANTTANNANSTAQDALEIAEEAKTTAESAVVDTDSAVEEMTTLLNQATQQATNATQQAQNAAASAASAASAAQSAVDDATEMLNAVVAYIPQNLTEDQQAQARENIAGVGFEDYATASTGGVVKVTGSDGITINGSGEIAVDFSQMPTDKFEDLLKSIRVPIWLTANKQFYVDKTTGSDTLDEGRGESSSKPFKTIRACVKYLTDNYNMSIYRAYVNVTPNTYTEQLNFGSYSVTTGLVYLRSTDSSQKVIVENPTSVATTANISKANYNFQYFDFVVNVTTQNVLRSNSVVSCAYVSSYSSVLFLDCDFHLNVSNSDKPAAFLGRMIRVGAYGVAEVQNTTNIKATNTSGFSMNAVFTSSGGKFNFLGSTDQTYCYISGDFSTVVASSNGAIQANSNGSISDIIVTTPGGETCTGKRYSAESGGSINTIGGGPEFFPGSKAGTVEASTYSWYK